ncbi:MAG: hypothetical protein GOMPHAMPRED_000990 [Gomphillus americanus]|uniref:Mitochondrial pyruvate carrier n=1 Tax=Gomphillus americanus TaxID=1940652 RepID=A0A8H3IFA6_9LECA|nr:MAG: hypothetical protein GOMPHAMPRED_000990 [Gomphillus americanus]
MAAAIKALNAKIRSNPVLDYVCSTHFWGPVSNFGIPVAAVLDTKKDPEIISGQFTAVLMVYSATFSRYAMAVTPKNYLLLACHITNFSAQTVQIGSLTERTCSGGGRERSLAEGAKTGIASVQEKGKEVVDKAKDLVKTN